MADNFGVKIGVEGEKEFKNALRDINASFKVLASEMNLVTAQFDKQDKSIGAMTARNAVLNKEIDAQKDKISTLQSALQNATDSFGENDRRTQSWATQLNNAQAELIGMEKELTSNNKVLDETGQELSEAGQEADAFGDQMEDAGERSKESGGKLEALGSIAKGIGVALAAAVVAIGAAVGVAAGHINEAVNVYAGFEDSMMQVAATMGMSTQEIERGSEAYNLLEQAAKDAGANTRYTASEAAEALNYLALAGYEAEKAAATLPGVLNLAAAGNMSLASASDLVTDAMSALAMETSQIDMFMDQMARTSQKSNTNVQQLGEGMLVVAGTATSTGQELVTLNTSLGVLADNGIKSAEGGTHLRNVLLSLASPTDKARGQLDALGVAVYDNDGNMRQLNEIMTDLNVSLGDMTQEDRTNALYNIFNKTDLNAVNALLGSTSGRFDELAASIRDSEGAAQTMADTMEGGLAGAQRSFASATEGMQIELGSLFAGMKKTMLTESTDIIRTFTKNLQEAGGDWSKIGVAVGQLLSDFIDIAAQALPQIAQIGMDVIRMLGQAIIDNLPTLVATASSIVLTLLEGLISAIPSLTDGALQLVLVLVNGLIENLPAIAEAAVIMIATLVSGIGAALPQLLPAALQAILTVVTGLLQNIPMLIEAALQLIVGLAEGLILAIPVLIEALPQIIDAILTSLLAALPLLVDAGVQLLTALVTNLPLIIESIIAVLPLIIDSIIATTVQLTPLIIEAGVKLFVALIKNQAQFVKTILEAVPVIIAALVKAIGEKVGEMARAGENLIKGLWQGILNVKDWILNKIRGFMDDITDGIKRFFGIHSPSTVFAGIGRNLGLGIGVGFEDAMDEVGRDMQNAIPTDFTMNAGVTGGYEGKAGRGAGGNVTQNIQITSPKALSEKEAAREFRNLSRKLALGVV